MTNGNKKWLYFSLGVLTSILGWIIYTLYHIFGKPVLPTEGNDSNVEPTYSLSEIQKKFFPNKTIGELFWNRVADKIIANRKPALIRLAEAKIVVDKLTSTYTIPDPNSLDDLDNTQPIKIDLEPSAKDLEDWAEYIE